MKWAGNVRLLAFEPAACRPVAEHVYRLGDPTDPAYLTRGAAPDDGKLCAIAAIDADSLLVIESDDAGLAWLYRIDLGGATDTLTRAPSRNDTTLEETADLEHAGIVPVCKTLVADLTPLVPWMHRDVYGGAGRSAAALLKLEGIALLGPDRLAIVNDNDFGLNLPPGATCRTCLWIVTLAPPLEADGPAAPRAAAMSR